MVEYLDINFDYSFRLYGIVAHVKPEKLCVSLNKIWNISFQREDDIEVHKKKSQVLLMPKFFADNIENYIQYSLYCNKIQNFWAFDECKNIDYLLKTEGDYDDFKLNIDSIPFILHCKEIDINIIKNKQYFLL